MDERMLKTGTLPVVGEVDRLPQVGNGKLKAQPAEEEDEEGFHDDLAGLPFPGISQRSFSADFADFAD